MALTPREPTTPMADDYHIQGTVIEDQPSTAQNVVHALQVLLIIVVAILALAIVWTLGMVFNIL
ncbi:MAG TPA: hypothetical protein VME45_22890 [Stellaceae bacterium]|nr:hypothetical protein [Stellaceae bacterium]